MNKHYNKQSRQLLLVKLKDAFWFGLLSFIFFGGGLVSLSLRYLVQLTVCDGLANLCSQSEFVSGHTISIFKFVRNNQYRKQNLQFMQNASTKE